MRNHNPTPFTLTKEEFRSLRNGDIVLVCGRYLRTIQQGPADKPAAEQGPKGNTLWATVTKVRKSQYSSPTRPVMWSEVSRIWKRTGLTNKHTLNCLEYRRMIEMGIADPSAELDKEWGREVRQWQRLGRTPYVPPKKLLVRKECML